jgi:8-oxo-dGTP pyrophosphatase MutT (NUDIX family)
MFDRDDLPQRISHRLTHTDVTPLQENFPPDFFNSPPKAAAVLMPLIRKQDGWHFLFIRRTQHDKDRHSGQVAFPGGQVDPDDKNSYATALREAHEEIGLQSHAVDVLGSLNSYRTISNFQVTGVVAQITSAFRASPDPREVDRVFTIPLKWLANPGNLERRPRLLPGMQQQTDVLYYRRYDNELLWGVTARLVESIIRVL